MPGTHRRRTVAELASEMPQLQGRFANSVGDSSLASPAPVAPFDCASGRQRGRVSVSGRWVGTSDKVVASVGVSAKCCFARAARRERLRRVPRHAGAGGGLARRALPVHGQAPWRAPGRREWCRTTLLGVWGGRKARASGRGNATSRGGRLSTAALIPAQWSQHPRSRFRSLCRHVKRSARSCR